MLQLTHLVILYLNPATQAEGNMTIQNLKLTSPGHNDIHVRESNQSLY